MMDVRVRVWVSRRQVRIRIDVSFFMVYVRVAVRSVPSEPKNCRRLGLYVRSRVRLDFLCAG